MSITNENQLNANSITQLLLLNLGSRNACLRALVAHPNDLNAAANWIIEHQSDANINTNPFAAVSQPTSTVPAPTTTTTTITTTTTNTNASSSNSSMAASSVDQPSQHKMVQSVMNLGYTRDDALRAYRNVSGIDRGDTAKLVEYLVNNPAKSSYSSKYNPSYYPYSSSTKKKAKRPVINIDEIEVEQEEICDFSECECLQHIAIVLGEYKAFIVRMSNEQEHDAVDEQNGFYAHFLKAICGEDGDEDDGDGDGDDDEEEDERYTLSDVMSDFVHILMVHDRRYGEFQRIYKYMMSDDGLKGPIEDEAGTVDVVVRSASSHSFDDESRKQKYFGFRSVNEILIQQLCDSMYSYLVRGYATASRLDPVQWDAMETELGIKQKVDSSNNDNQRKARDKVLSSFVESVHFVDALKVLDSQKSAQRGSWRSDRKFWSGFDVEALETRIDPKELKAKKAAAKRKEKAVHSMNGGDEEKEDSKMEDEKENESGSAVTTSTMTQKKDFKYGVRFNYWPQEVQDVDAVVITEDEARYKSLKEELTENTVCRLSAFEYELLAQKAAIYSETEHCSESVEAGVNQFGIPLLAKMTMDHLMAVLLYTNHPKMKKALCLSMLRLDGESESSLKCRHSHFYHFGKSLRESVSAFGVEAHKSESKLFYHGMPRHDVLRRDDAIDSLFILVPFSTTSSLEMCHRDCVEDNGLMLAMKGFVSKYFDCSWISDSHHEAERLFFGGERALTINQCIDSRFGFDHHRIMSALRALRTVFTMEMDGDRHPLDLSDAVKETVRRLIVRRLHRQNGDDEESKEKEMEPNSMIDVESKDNALSLVVPDDVEKELASFWSTTSAVTMHYDAMYDVKAFSFLAPLLMTKTRTFVRCDVLQTVFPKICSLKMSGLPLTSLTLFYVKSVIAGQSETENGGDGLREIEMVDPKTTAMSVSAVIEDEKRNLAEMQWTMESVDGCSLNLKYSEVPVVIKDPTPPPPLISIKSQEEMVADRDDGKEAESTEQSPSTKKVVRRKVIRKRVVKRKKVVNPEEAKPSPAEEAQTE